MPTTIAEIITENVIKQLEQGVAPWRKPWSTSVPRNLITKRPYRGLNVFMLATQGYGSPYWLTFNQAKQLGAHVRQGEKSSMVMFWKIDELVRRKIDADGEPADEKGKSILLRYYRVFNVEQCDGLRALHGDDRKPVNPIAECESIVERMPNNKCSGWHTLGTVAGIGLTTAIGGAAGAEAAEANAGEEGYEFSHWIPNRMGGPRSIFNGNYVSRRVPLSDRSL